MITELTGIIQRELHCCCVSRISATAQIAVRITFKAFQSTIFSPVIQFIRTFVLCIIGRRIIIAIKSFCIQTLYAWNVVSQCQGTIKVNTFLTAITGEITIDSSYRVFRFAHFTIPGRIVMITVYISF